MVKPKTVRENMQLMTTGALVSPSKYIIKYLTSNDKWCILNELKYKVTLTVIEIWKEQDLQAICIQD